MNGPCAKGSRKAGFRAGHIAIVLAFVATLLVVVRLFLLDVVSVTGRSMAPTLLGGRVVFVNKAAYGIRRPFRYGYLLRWATPRSGDIVAVRHPQTGDLLIKRAAATPGDTFVLNRSTLQLQGRSARRDIAVFDSARRFFETYDQIPPETLLILGDNPSYSIDSRHFGPVAIELVSGRVIRGQP